jgi:hypothetical protein
MREASVERAGYPGSQRAGQEPSLATATKKGDGRREALGAAGATSGTDD